MSYRDVLTCGDSFCLTSCHLGFVSNSCHFLRGRWYASLRLPRDHYVRLDGNDYSVHPAGIGRWVLVGADLNRVQAFCDGELVADHMRIWATRQTISDPSHVEAAKVLRRKRISAARRIPEPEVATRYWTTTTPHWVWTSTVGWHDSGH